MPTPAADAMLPNAQAMAQVAQRIPGVVHLMPDLKLPPLTMNLLMHAALKNAAPVRAVYSHIGDGLKKWVAGA